MNSNLFRLKKILDNKIGKRIRIKKIIFPKDSLGAVALASAEWVQGGLYALYILWTNGNAEPGYESLFYSEKPATIISARILLGYLVITFKNPNESGEGVNFYRLNGFNPKIIEQIKKRRETAALQNHKIS